VRAAWYDRTGPAREVIQVGERPDPEPGPGEVRVRVHASGINPSDVKRRAGWLGLEMPFPRVIPHSDGAGVVDAVGETVSKGARVDRLPALGVGDSVWIWNAQAGDRSFGTAAEYVSLPAEQVARLPQGVDFSTGACLGVPACTAYYALFRDGSIEGATILVAGGAGAVGHYAVQMAALRGARVIATVSSDEKAEVARAGGADHVIDYTREDVVARTLSLTDGVGVDRIIEVDLGANLPIDTAVIRPRGVIATYSSTRVPEPVLPYYELAFRGVTVWFVQGYLIPPGARAAAVRDLDTWLSDGSLETRIAARFPLEETAASHAAAEAGDLIGNVVVEIG
jgi:NADPH2:quinone reductase